MIHRCKYNKKMQINIKKYDKIRLIWFISNILNILNFDLFLINFIFWFKHLKYL